MMMMEDYCTINFSLCLMCKEEFIIKKKNLFLLLSSPSALTFMYSLNRYLFNSSARNLYTISDAQKSPKG